MLVRQLQPADRRSKVPAKESARRDGRAFFLLSTFRMTYLRGKSRIFGEIIFGLFSGTWMRFVISRGIDRTESYTANRWGFGISSSRTGGARLKASASRSAVASRLALRWSATRHSRGGRNIGRRFAAHEHRSLKDPVRPLRDCRRALPHRFRRAQHQPACFSRLATRASRLQSSASEFFSKLRSRAGSGP